MLGRLVHGNEVTVLSRGGRHRRAAEAGDEFPLFRSDAVVSDVPGTFVLLTFADCVPLVFWDPIRGVIGAAHAGWRGTSMGIGPEVIRAMHREWGTDPCDMVVGIGPSIGPCCYTVGAEVPEQFRRNGLEPSMVGTDAGARLDLWTTTERQLRSCGVSGDSIENMRLCTRCHRATFFSHRGEAGRTGRFGLCVGLPDA
jgi:YfiH family protein